MSVARHHAEWLSLVEVSGPFLSMMVLLRVFPEGLDKGEDASETRFRLDAAHEEWLDNQGSLSPDPAIHRAWLRYVLKDILEIDSGLFAEGQSIPPECSVLVAEHGERLAPTMAVVDPPGRPTAGKARVLIDLLPRGQSLDSPLSGARWKASPATRMMTLLHGAGVRLGLVTNGEHWMLVHAAPTETTTYVSFYTSLFLEEPLTLQAFQSLLGTHRLFGVRDEDTLESLFKESSQNQQEVTDQLGLQVRRAVEVLIQTFDRIDRDCARTLLKDVSETVLYEAAVTVMMRLVFLFAAEEKGLLLLGDALYDQHYAVSTLRDQLQAAADAHGSEVLQRRHDAWSRLLATFRAVHGGVRHETMRLPPYGGSLFDPDRFPFLEGRPAGSRWRDVPAHPVGVDNLTVLDLLSSLQLLEVRVRGGGPAEARRLSFRALDVEQIGHVYEGLLDHTAKRASVPVLSLSGSKGKEPEIEITKLEELRAQGEDKLLAFLKEETGKSESALKKALAERLSKEDAPRWQLACDNDRALLGRVQPWVGLVRKDTHDRPVVFGAHAVYVTEGQERRATGTHYTPKSLTEPIVQYTLEPLVYEGPAEGWPKEKWKLKSAREILALRVCDMAMGSGAFLVQACRYLSERLVEAWETAEKDAGGKLVVTPEGALGTGSPTERPLPKNEDERLAIARRVVADRCLYGVDRNPMAVEMAKLSLWLVTLQKDRPFTFVDHALRCGDSLIGLTDPAQIEHFHMDPVRGKRLHGTLFEWTRACGPALAKAIELRRRLESFSVETVKHADEKGRLLAEADAAIVDARLISDLVVGAALATATKPENALDDELLRVSALLAAAFETHAQEERAARMRDLRIRATALLNTGKQAHHPERRPFHWVLEFPEVCAQAPQGRFAALVGNPPFKGGSHLAPMLGDDYKSALVRHLANEISGIRGQVDLSAYFLLRNVQLAGSPGTLSCVGVIVTNTIAQGDTRDAGLGQILARPDHVIFRAERSLKWPGNAMLEISMLWLALGPTTMTPILNGESVAEIDSRLDAVARAGASGASDAFRLMANRGKAGTGAKIYGKGFLMQSAEAIAKIREMPRVAEVLLPYWNGEELNSVVGSIPPRFVIHFRRWPLDRSTGEVGPCATDFPDLLRIVEERVKPQRDALRGDYSVARSRRENWWKFSNDAEEIYAKLRAFDQFPARSRVSVLHIVRMASPDWVCDEDTVVFAVEDFCVLQSALHEAWIDRFSSTMRTDARYTVANCFETFPFPLNVTPKDVRDSFLYTREEITRGRKEGLSTLYRAMHTPSCREGDIIRLRNSHVVLDQAVATTYEWGDIDLGHGFYETRQGPRFTISPTARQRLLERLLKLNHARHAAEEAQVVLETKARKEGASAAVPVETHAPVEQGAFDFGEMVTPRPSAVRRGRRPRKS